MPISTAQREYSTLSICWRKSNTIFIFSTEIVYFFRELLTKNSLISRNWAKMAQSWSYRHLNLLYCEMLSATLCILLFQIIYLTPLFQMPLLLCSLQYCIGHELFENLCWHFSYLLRRSFPWMFAKISKCFLFSGIVLITSTDNDNGRAGRRQWNKWATALHRSSTTNNQQPTTDKQWTNAQPPDMRQSTVFTTSNGNQRSSGQQLNNRKQYMTIGTKAVHGTTCSCLKIRQNTESEEIRQYQEGRKTPFPLPPKTMHQKRHFCQQHYTTKML